ncbi:MAG: HDOD domain-containing protein [Thermoleophilaceae bacterium]
MAPSATAAKASTKASTKTPAKNSKSRIAAPSSRRHNEGHGRRLTAAFEALEAFPALAESRNRLLKTVREDGVSVSDVVECIESDVALVIAVLRIANRARSPKRGKIAAIPKAVEVLTPGGVEALASRTATFDFFERTPVWDVLPERFRLHAVATQRAAERVAREIGYEQRDELLVSALLHDIGKLVLVHAYPGYPQHIHGDARTPEERVMRERRELGVDHGVVGGVLARRWGLPNRLATAIERHHSEDGGEEATIVRLGDMLAHYSQGHPVDPNEMVRVGKLIDLSPEALRGVMYELPYAGQGSPRQIEPCPLSTREVEVLKRLAEGKVYKQIALELSLSTSTVRTHLHNTYGKLGAVDRAQAVLVATERGWL